MEENCIDLLTIIPKNEIIKHRIPCLKQAIKSMLDFDKKRRKEMECFLGVFQEVLVLRCEAY